MALITEVSLPSEVFKADWGKHEISTRHPLILHKCGSKISQNYENTVINVSTKLVITELNAFKKYDLISVTKLQETNISIL